MLAHKIRPVITTATTKILSIAHFRKALVLYLEILEEFKTFSKLIITYLYTSYVLCDSSHFKEENILYIKYSFNKCEETCTLVQKIKCFERNNGKHFYLTIENCALALPTARSNETKEILMNSTKHFNTNNTSTTELILNAISLVCSRFYRLTSFLYFPLSRFQHQLVCLWKLCSFYSARHRRDANRKRRIQLNIFDSTKFSSA